MSDLVICKLSDCSCTVAGGKEVILLCEKVAKGKDILVMYGHQLYLYLLSLSVSFVLMVKSFVVVIVVMFCRILPYLFKHYT